MKRLYLLPLLALPFLTSALIPGSQDAKADEDRAAVERAVLDYVEGIYEVKPEYIERSVHEDLQKFGFWRSTADSPYQGSPMEFGALVDLAGKWNLDGKRASADSPKKVELLDVLDQTASAKLTAEWGIDYMHLAKYDGKWKIQHVMWQSHPSK